MAGPPPRNLKSPSESTRCSRSTAGAEILRSVFNRLVGMALSVRQPTASFVRLALQVAKVRRGFVARVGRLGRVHRAHSPDRYCAESMMLSRIRGIVSFGFTVSRGVSVVSSIRAPGSSLRFDAHPATTAVTTASSTRLINPSLEAILFT